LCVCVGGRALARARARALLQGHVQVEGYALCVQGLGFGLHSVRSRFRVWSSLSLDSHKTWQTLSTPCSRPM
jgi:hypothetical protein